MAWNFSTDKTAEFKNHAKKIKKQMSASRIIIMGFALLILGGAFLLMLPAASRTGHMTPFSEALFTATSAVCVTGLVVHDTATYWSGFGQAVLLFLIQTGGMGVVTVAVAVAVAAGRKIGLMQRSTMQEAIAAPQVGGIVRLTEFILKTTFAIELAGAVILAPAFCGEFGLRKGLWYALFHSVSAFCNAGFDLMGVKEHYSSLVSYAGNPVINLTIMLLIILGGIGFLTWEDIKVHRFCVQRYRMQTKTILCMTALLITLPAIYFYFWEFSGPAFEGASVQEKICMSLFQAVSPRTAGFNTADLTKLSEPGQMITVLLMLIGGSPGSTAGGMKTTTVAVLLASAFAVFKRKEDAQLFKRRVPLESVRSAAAVMLMYVMLFFAGAVLLSCLEGEPMVRCMFETASAIGTVGLSLGMTPQLGFASRLILIVLMYMGRVGGLTIIFATVSGSLKGLSRLPQEKITVG